MVNWHLSWLLPRLVSTGLLMVLLLASSGAVAAEVVAQLDRLKVTEGETVTLVLQSGDPKQSLEADFSVLAADFEILDRRSETQMSIVNGRQAATVRLLLTLEPRRTGQLVIPALTLPGATTRPIRLTVEPAPQLAPGELPPVFIEVALDPQEGPYYVLAQLSLTVRIFYQQNLTEAAINPPSPELASVRLLDEVPYQADRNGEKYRVLERRYAIFPERSGEMVIPPMQLSGRLIERPADRLWQPSVRGRRVRVESDPLVLSIAPRPPQFQGDHWLPARKIALSQQISDAEELRVGEPVTRTVILDAEGLEEHMLEEPAWPAMTNVRIYPDQPQGISRDNGQWVLGHKEFRYAVVPEQAGDLVLPEIRLNWWDTVNHRQRTAVLPEHRVTVLPSTAIQPEAAELAGGRAASQDGTPGLAHETGAVQFWQLLSAVLAVLWLLTIALYLRRNGPARHKPGTASDMGQDESDLLAVLKRACQQGQAAQARQLLSRWVRRHGPDYAAGSLMQFAAKVPDQELADELRRSDAHSFSDAAAGPWDGKPLWRAFSAWRNGQQRGAPAERLAAPDLYARTRQA